MRQPDDPGSLPPLPAARAWWGWPFVVMGAAVLGFAVGVFLS